LRVGACTACARRGWLLGELSPLLNYHQGHPQRLGELLELPDEQLIDALAGSRREQLHARYRALPVDDQPQRRQAGWLCRHDLRYPSLLAATPAPPTLWIAGGAGRLESLLGRPTVGILSSAEASPYGAEMARAFARAFASAGLTVVAGLSGPIALAAHEGVREAGGAIVGVLADGLATAGGSRAVTAARILRSGIVVSLLEPDASGRGWGAIAAERVIVGISRTVVLVEAPETDRGIHGARLARSLGRPVGALPGMLTSVLAAGPHAMITAGGHLLRGPEDVLDLLAGLGCAPPGPLPAPSRPKLAPRLQEVLDAVGAGQDTAEWPSAALGELEAAGLLRRLPGGRYARRDPLPRAIGRRGD
jgi:DNA processing protein